MFIFAIPSGLRYNDVCLPPGAQTNRPDYGRAGEYDGQVKRLASPLTILGVSFLSEVAYCVRAAISSEFSAMS